MTKLSLIFFFLIIFQLTAFSQHCLPEGITFSSQAQIDSFQVDYPGCSAIEGDVMICENDISDLAGLSGLDSIFGTLEFQNTNQLIDMTGLNNLNFIGGDLFLYSNEGIMNFAGLENLHAIGGSLELFYNPVMTSLTGLENLTYAGNVNILFNDSLTSLSGLVELDSIGLGLSIEENYMLIDLTGLEGLNSIGGNLKILNNYSLSSLDGLDNINAASIGELNISYNQNLATCNVQSICDYLVSPNGSITICKNAPGCENPHEIAQVCGITLPCLPFGNYYFLSQSDIDNFRSYYHDCNQLEGYVVIGGVDITHLDSLMGIDTINGTLQICGNENLLSLSGLNNLKRIQGSLSIGDFECSGNSSLTSLEGLNNLASVGGGMQIMNNDGLLNLLGLDTLSEIGGGVGIMYNASLKNLLGMEDLISAGTIYISSNISLLTLNGLQNLINLDGVISIQNNPALFSIKGISNINADLIFTLHLDNNNILSNCDVKSICDYLTGSHEYADIHDNAPGCNSQEEVELACGVGVEEVVSRQSSVVSYPNPVTDHVIFDIHLKEPAKAKLTVYSSLGQHLATILDEPLEKGNNLVSWNTENFPSGIYFYCISMYSQSLTGKLVIVK